MKVEFLLFFGKKSGQEAVTSPSRFSIYRHATTLSELGAHTAQAYIWTRDNFWKCLRQISISHLPHESKKNSSVVERGDSVDLVFCAFRAVVDVAFNNADMDVALLLAREITRVMAIPEHSHGACRVSVLKDPQQIQDSSLPSSCLGKYTSTDALVLQLASWMKGNKDILGGSIEMDGKSERRYRDALEGRLWFVDGNVRMICSSAATSIRFFPETATVEAQLEVIFDCVEVRLSKEEKYLSGEVRKWLYTTVSSQMRCSALTCFACLPPTLASVVKRLPRSLLNESLCYHLVYSPVRYSLEDRPSLNDKRSGSFVVVRPFASQATLEKGGNYSGDLSKGEEHIINKETETFDVVRCELEATHLHNRAVRTPIEPLPSFLYRLLLDEASVPLSLFSRSVQWCFGGSSQENLEEIRLGIHISYALERWRRHLEESLHESLTLNSCTFSKSAVIGIVSGLLAQAKSQLQKILDSCFPNNLSENYRRAIMAPYPVNYSFVVHPRVYGSDSQKDESTTKSAARQYFKFFDKAMMEMSSYHEKGNENDECILDEEEERETSMSSITSGNTKSRGSTFSESDAIRDNAEEVEQLFFDDLHLTKSGAVLASSSSGPIKMDKNAIRNVIVNPLFTNSISFFADCND